MDVARLSVAHSQVNVGQQVSIALLKQVMEISETSSNAVTEMLQTSSIQTPHPSLGRIIDLSV